MSSSSASMVSPLSSKGRRGVSSMGGIGFQQWADGGCYGGLICSLLAAACLAAYALRRRRGTPRQFARAVLICLIATSLMLPPVWWDLNRIEVYGPALG